VDVDADRAARLATRYGMPHQGTDLRALLDAGEVDAVHVCTPPAVHRDAAVAALRAGSHVVVEKPAVLWLAQADALAVAKREAAGAGLPGRFT
jgi:predicted dehydrogenase